jgi:hypothetical protein
MKRPPESESAVALGAHLTPFEMRNFPRRAELFAAAMLLPSCFFPSCASELASRGHSSLSELTRVSLYPSSPLAFHNQSSCTEFDRLTIERKYKIGRG